MGIFSEILNAIIHFRNHSFLFYYFIPVKVTVVLESFPNTGRETPEWDSILLACLGGGRKLDIFQWKFPYLMFRKEAEKNMAENCLCIP